MLQAARRNASTVRKLWGPSSETDRRKVSTVSTLYGPLSYPDHSRRTEKPLTEAPQAPLCIYEMALVNRRLWRYPDWRYSEVRQKRAPGIDWKWAPRRLIA